MIIARLYAEHVYYNRMIFFFGLFIRLINNAKYESKKGF